MTKHKTKKKRKAILREFYHYLIGTVLIIFGGHWISSITGLETWALNSGLIGLGGLFLYYLVIYIGIDQALHKIFKL